MLMTTDVGIPPLPRNGVHRARLADALERGIPYYKLIQVIAPAGYGKTTLVAQWARESRRAIAWLSLSEDHNNPEGFLRTLLMAWEQVQPDIRRRDVGILLGGVMPDLGAVLPAFINTAAEISDDTVFVLDDYHLVTNDAVHEAMTFLLDHLPPQTHFILTTRAEAPLPLARYRARDEMMDVDVQALRFRPDEAAEFLNNSLGLSLSPVEAGALQAQLEGWATGLQLAALSMRGASSTQPAEIGGDQRYIADYLSEEVLARLDDETEQFLLHTSILDQLSGPLCDALTGRNDGQVTLERLERENLFLVALDDSRRRYRYHHVFADFLRRRLDRREADKVATLHQKAAAWYLAHDRPEQAFDHAIAGNSEPLFNDIVENYGFVKLISGEIRLLQHWLEITPQQWFESSPRIALLQAGILMFSGQIDAMSRQLDQLEARAHAADFDNPWLLPRVTALRCFRACFQFRLEEAQALGDQALHELPADDFDFRLDIHGALGDTYRKAGQWQKSKDAYLHSLDYIQASGFPARSATVFGALADLELRQGHLQTAAGYWRRALQAIVDPENWGRNPLPLSGWIHIRIGELFYEHNDLPAASEHVGQGLERAELAGDVRAMIAGYLIAGRLKLTAGETVEAAAYLAKARPLVESAEFAGWTSRFERLQLELWLAQNRLQEAANWCNRMLDETDIEERPDSAMALLAMAHVLLVKVDRASIETALELVERLRRAAEETGRTHILIEALALQALAGWQQGERTGALVTIEHSLLLAEPEGYVRMFADLGLPMARLLQEARARDVMTDYVDRLLAAAGETPLAGGPLPEPLTERETEVLELAAAGLTNPEIGQQLVISPQTVKKHMSNILGKLAAGNRTEAAARARELGLLV